MEGLTSIRTRSWRLAAIALSVLLVAAFAFACGDDDDDDAGSTTTPTETSEATTTAEASGTADAGDAAYPLKVTDLLGREVEIAEKPTTVVAISPTAVELVYAVGETVVGRSSSADFPPEAQEATDVGTAYQPSFDTILSLSPDLIIADSVIQGGADYRQPLEQLGVPVIFAGAESYQDVIDGLTLVGKVFDAQENAEEVIAGIEKARDDAKAAIEGKNLSVVAMIAGRDQTLYAAKDASYVGDLLKITGIENPASSQPDAGPFPGYSTLAPEKLVEYDPQIIFTISPGSASGAPLLSTLIPNIPPFRGLQAVTSGAIVELDVELFLESPGPRIVEAFAALAAAADKAQ
ncbi:MAG: ABC transporter substrate-binding protein [Dehalococcoidia bacterium]|nr:ABC transporter substrate-binding protein [Dehalococcoidia bacterium]